MFNILVTGANGQLGMEIQELSKEYKYNFFFSCRDILDITNQDKIEEFVIKNSINVVINCAAYTAVDNAQNDEINANLTNHKGVLFLANICKKKSIQLIHISTDYVFSGQNFKPYHEEDKTEPLSVYGKSKLDGENAICEARLKNSIIIRTSWLYSSFGSNFVKTILRLSHEKESLNVVFDQIGSPTYAKDLARSILEILPNIKNDKIQIYHYSNEGVLSWYDFAKEIVKMAKLPCKINPITSKYFATIAPRPHFSVLDKSKIKDDFKITIPYWKDSLDECLNKMGVRK